MKKYRNRYRHVTRDLIREMFNAPGFSKKNEELVLETRDFIVERALFRGWDIIVGDTNFANINWTRMCEIAKRVGNVRVVEKFFDVPLRECLKRNPNRRCPVPEEVIKSMYSKYLKNKQVEIRDEYFPKVPKTEWMLKRDENKKDYIVIDMDGTQAINTTRSYYDNTRGDEDSPFEPIVKLVNKIVKEYVTIIVSGKTKYCMEKNKDGLEVYTDVPRDAEVYMREEGDNRKDIVVKREIYEKYLKDRFNVAYILDDRPVVCRMWRDLGIPVLQLDDRNF